MTTEHFWFKPEDEPLPPPPLQRRRTGDLTSDAVYVYTNDIVRAVNVAGATGRPLLVDGPSGCGKSSLARHIAAWMQWPLQFFPVTSRTQATDLLYTIDQLGRLQDAQAERLRPLGEYVRPGILWEAFDPEGAGTRSATASPRDGGWGDSTSSAFNVPVRGPGHGSVVLLDEIDKADPDVPNNLLVPLGSYVFPVPELDLKVYAQRLPLIILTTNNERKLPAAFLRRCVHVKVPAPDNARLLAAGRAHYPVDEAQVAIEAVANLLAPPDVPTVEGTVSIAEYLDAVRACVSLKIDPNSEDWKWMRTIVVEA